MTKRDFVDAVADRAGLSGAMRPPRSTRCSTRSPTRSRTVTRSPLRASGKFSTSAQAAHMGVNPRTGQRVQIAATTVPKFSASGALQAAVKG